MARQQLPAKPFEIEAGHRARFFNFTAAIGWMTADLLHCLAGIRLSLTRPTVRWAYCRRAP